MTKLSAVTTLLLVAGSASGFAPASAPQNAFGVAAVRRSDESATALSLFGGKKEGGGGDKKAPGMMDQLAMFKKAQEIASKKQALDKELQEMDMKGTAADGKVSVTIKYVPAQLPVSPSPGYDAVAVDIDEEYLESASCEDLSEALVVAIRDGETIATTTVAEKYKALDSELGSILGGMAGPQAEGTAAS